MQGQSFLTGYITDSSGTKIPDVSIFTSDQLNYCISGENGKYFLKLPSNKRQVVYFSYSQRRVSRTIEPLKEGETLRLDVILNVSVGLDGFTKYGEKDRERISTIEIEAKKLERFPSVTGSVESFLKFFGAGAGNELSSGYNVRGGNYDENLVYINDIEVYRPFLIRAGQQEGLSIINPDMVDRLTFSSGGFDARYGDKMSSVLDIRYKVPVAFETSVTASMLGSSVYVGNQTRKKRLSFILGARYRSNKLLFNSLDVSGDYRPLNVDFQSLIRYRFNSNLSFSWLSNLAYNRYALAPLSRQTSFGTVSTALRLNIEMGGREEMNYLVALNGLTFEYDDLKNTSVKWINSYYVTTENEHFTTEGAYGLFELDNNLGSEDLGTEKRSLGYGYFINQARNDLKAEVFNSTIKGIQKHGRSTWYYGVKFQTENIEDVLNEWKYNDSAGFNIAVERQTGKYILLDERIKAENEVSSYRASAYLQNSLLIDKASNLKMNAGVRHQYWSLNEQNMFSPRVALSYEPNKKFNDTLLRNVKNIRTYDSLKKKDVVLKLAGGVYYQPPFYREYRRLDGRLNKNIRAQRSIHIVMGSDLNFTAWGRPFKLVNELYYKFLNDLIPYYIDNVRIRYFAENSSKGYATGFDTRVNGEFIKGLESWLSFSILQTRENITYQNESGETVNSGYLRRPTDQRVNFSILFADELGMNPTFKLHLGLVYGARVPYYFKGEARYDKTPNTIPPYRRVDVGFSKEIIGGAAGSSIRYKRIESLWASLELFNMLDFNNTVSYIWVKDANNTTYGVPNYLTGRRLNLKFILRIK
ncbi:MAG: TonB-dependent receptor [Flavobacteriales bacterium]|nr:TonB-dependent receptor [Flavobacteriales bacterium]